MKISLLKSGYYRIFINGKYRRLHRYIMEKHLLEISPKSIFLKRGKLRIDIIVHHKDGNKTNNDISNLVCVTIKEHSKIHLIKYPDMTYNEKQRMWHTDLCKCGKPKDKYRMQCKDCHLSHRINGRFARREK